MEEARPFQEALYPSFLPLQGPVGECLPGSHSCCWSSLFLLKTMCCSTHTWDLPDHALKGRACETAPVLPQPGRQRWVPLPPMVGGADRI